MSLGQDDQLVLVVLEAENVGLDALLADVAAAVVDGDADGGSLLERSLGEGSLVGSGQNSRLLCLVSTNLELSGGESTSGTDLRGVLEGLLADSGAEESVDGAGSDTCGLLHGV